MNAKRAKDAANAAYEASQAAAQVHTDPSAAQGIQHEPVTTMDIDQTEATESKKRKHEERDGETADIKKTKTGMIA